MKIEITSATVLRGNGADQIMLHTELAEGCWPYKGTASLKLMVAADSAEEWLEKNIPEVTYEVIKMR